MVDAFLALGALEREIAAVDATPDQEVPARPVPQPAEQHHQREVDIRADAALAVAAERDVKVIAEPCGERQVPPPPEFRDRLRAVRRIEVLREHESEHQTEADRHVRVAGKIEIDLECIRDRAVPGVETAQVARVERGVSDLAARIRQQDLLRHAEHEERGAAREFLPGERAVAELVRHILEPDNRAGYELREHRNITRVIDEIGHDLRVAAVHVDHVAHALERVETDAKRQHHAEESQILRFRNAQRRHRRVVVVEPEVEILEEAEDRQVTDDGKRDEELLPRRVYAHQAAVRVVHARVEQHQQAEPWIRPAVEDVAEDRQREVTQLFRCGIVPQKRQRKEEEDEEIGGENH